jgi:hypothetical protein
MLNTITIIQHMAAIIYKTKEQHLEGLAGLNKQQLQQQQMQ